MLSLLSGKQVAEGDFSGIRKEEIKPVYSKKEIMRNGTKLKEILRHHTIDVSMDNGHFRICVFSKNELIPDGDLEFHTVIGKSWSDAIGKAHRLAQKNEKEDVNTE